MIEFILENLFSMIADLSVEKIIELKNQYTNQHILSMTADQYVNTDYFKTEYRNVIAVIDKDKILAIDSKNIEPSSSVAQLVINLAPVFEDMLITDDASLKRDIITAIATQYISKRKLAISLFDILETQKKDTDAILEKIDSVDTKTLMIADSLQKREALRDRAIQSGIGRKMSQLVHCAAQYFISIVTKKPPQTVGDSTTELTQYMNSIRKCIDEDFPDIDVGFLKKPVSVITPDPNGAIEPVYKDIEVLQFLMLFSHEIQKHIDELLKYSNLLPDAFIVSMIELWNAVDSDIYTHAVERGVAPLLRNSTPADVSVYVKEIKAQYKRLGETILEMEPYAI